MSKKDDLSLKQAKRLRNEEFADDADFAARFAFSPRLERLGYDKDKFKHINKNLVLTHLSNSEVERANRLLDAIQVLMNHNITTYYLVMKDGNKKRLDKSEAHYAQENGYIVLAETNNRFQNVLDFKTGQLFGMTSTASGAGSALLKEWKQQRVKQEKTIREEQEPNNWFGKAYRNKKSNRR